MGFHCGNTPSCCMKNCAMKYQLIMNRLMEDPAQAPGHHPRHARRPAQARARPRSSACRATPTASW